MKKQIMTLLAAGLLSAGAAAQQASDYLIFINPGHGGHDSDDRNVVIEPYEQGDPEGYWESNSNLTKGLWLRTMLEAKGYRVKMSRTTNTTADDLPLSTISAMANNAGADLFFSIHSNATGTSIRANFPLMLYRGWDSGADNPEDRVIAAILNKHLLENKATYWTDPSLNIRGDWSFYNWGYKVGLGVLRGLTVTGMLSEGSFHDYIPEAYRLMNEEFCRLEAWHFRRAVDEYFKQPGESTGQIGGRINDSRLPRKGDYIIHGEDKFATIQDATVELYNEAGTLVDTYTTHPVLVNGIYAFRDVAPGKYLLKVSAPTHYPTEAEIEVFADAITYRNIQMDRVRDTPPTVVAYTPLYKDGDEALLCNSPVTISFSWDMNTDATEKAFSIEPAVDGTFSWSELNYKLTFTPKQPLEISTLYTVRLSTDAEHAGGMKLEQPLEFSFLTTDRNFMEITRQYPCDGDEVHYDGAAVELRLDKIPEGSSVTSQITCVDSKGNSVAFSKTGKKVSGVRSRYGFIRLPFSQALTPGESYTVTFDGTIADRDGITIKAPVTATFTAIDAGTKATYPLFNEMTDASVFANDAASSQQLNKQSVAANTKIKLTGKQSIAFSYDFAETSGGVASWQRTASAEEPEISVGDKLGVHVYGDLSGNDLYFQLSGSAAVGYVHVAKLDFLGWRYIEVPVEADAFGGHLTGIRVEQEDADNTVDGTFYLGAIHRNASDGITDITAGGSVTIYPNPASEYLIANADCLIDSIELISLNGATVAVADGNVLNVSEITAGNYICRVTASGVVSVYKVIINH
ncbi:MAG: N-acetylmuramoyl-L-alanine amidase [Odoribacter sp.]|nr:N-acetylmuramoyl-L-alanine amidase [Odoribacter sp.]